MLPFIKLLSKEPTEIKNNIYYFDAHNYGDCFNEEDAMEWDSGRLANNWNKHCFLENPVTKKFQDNSVPAFTSNIGLSSTRGGQADYDTAAKEIFRCLAPGGYLYTIESEWTDIPTILQVFEKMNRQPWNCFTEKQTSWHDRFLAAGFEIISEELSNCRYFTKDDNELGEASCRYGIPVDVKETAFILRKN